MTISFGRLTNFDSYDAIYLTQFKIILNKIIECIKSRHENAKNRHENNHFVTKDSSNLISQLISCGIQPDRYQLLKTITFQTIFLYLGSRPYKDTKFIPLICLLPFFQHCIHALFDELDG